MCCVALSVSAEYSLKDFSLNHSDGIYKVSEKVVCSGVLMLDGKPVDTGSLRCIVKWEGTVVDTKVLPLDGKPFQVEYQGDKPGWLYYGFEVVDAEGNTVPQPLARQPQHKKTLVGEIGAYFDPQDMKTTIPCPEDFDEFWAKQKALVAEMDFAGVTCQRLEDPAEGVELYAIQVPIPGEGRPATAYLAKPAGAVDGTLPIYIEFLSWMNCDANKSFAVNGAKNGLLTFAATWHGFPVAQLAESYNANSKEFQAGSGISSRDTWTFKNMFLRVLRLLAYAKSRPEWNRQEFVVQGGSLGGIQTTFAAAMEPAVTFAAITVPAFCELDPELRHAKNASVMSRVLAHPTPEMCETVHYYDTVNFMARVKCPVCVATGFVDETCPPTSVICAYNNLPADTPKELTLNCRTGHFGTTANTAANKRIREIFHNKKLRRDSEL